IGNSRGGTNANHGGITAADCPGSTCRTLLQPCPICNAGKCAGGTNDGLVCTNGDSAIDGDFPTSHDCPPPPAKNIGSLPISFVLDTGTVTQTATDKPSQTNVFCGFCRNKVSNQSGRRCGGVASGAACSCARGRPHHGWRGQAVDAGQHLLHPAELQRARRRGGGPAGSRRRLPAGYGAEPAVSRSNREPARRVRAPGCPLSGRPDRSCNARATV